MTTGELFAQVYRDLKASENELALVREENTRLQAIVGRINHFATGTCDMPVKTRMRCIAKECQSVCEAAKQARAGK